MITGHTPRGREAGEIPAQSRYGERPPESASPVADLTVHARTFERKVGRTRAIHLVDPSFERLEPRGFAFCRDPSGHSPPEVQPCLRRRRRPHPCLPASRPSSRLAAHRRRVQRRGSIAIAPALGPSRRAMPSRRRPRSTRARARPSPSPAPSFPVTLTDDEGTAITSRRGPQKIVSLTPAVTETLFAVGAGTASGRHRRLERLSRGQASARCRHVGDRRRREDREPRP